MEPVQQHEQEELEARKVPGCMFVKLHVNINAMYMF